MFYAGVRPERVARAAALDGFGVPSEDLGRAPTKFRKWLDALLEPPTFAPYRNMAAVADRLQKNNPRLPRAKAEWLAPHWAEAMPDGTARLRADPKHKLPFPILARMDDMYAVWREIAAPLLWMRAAESDIGRWLAGGGEAAAEVARRFAHVRNGTLVEIADAGHMLHHDQPEEVARHLVAFFGRRPA
jgi:pimeloyl-ACP methyl ester carboxylesterase